MPLPRFLPPEIRALVERAEEARRQAEALLRVTRHALAETAALIEQCSWPQWGRFQLPRPEQGG
jgi:hypothetical protein